MDLCNSNLTKTCKVLINIDSFKKRKKTQVNITLLVFDSPILSKHRQKERTSLSVLSGQLLGLNVSHLVLCSPHRGLTGRRGHRTRHVGPRQMIACCCLEPMDPFHNTLGTTT